MNGPAGDERWIPRDCGEGAGTKDPGDGTCSCGLPGDPLCTNKVPGDGVLIRAADGLWDTWVGSEGGEEREKAAAGEDAYPWKTK